MNGAQIYGSARGKLAKGVLSRRFTCGSGNFLRGVHSPAWRQTASALPRQQMRTAEYSAPATDPMNLQMFYEAIDFFTNSKLMEKFLIFGFRDFGQTDFST